MTLRLSQCVVQELVEQSAVGQAGQEIEVGELADLLLCSSARNELTNLQADGLRNPKQSCVRLADIPAEELEHDLHRGIFKAPRPSRAVAESGVRAGVFNNRSGRIDMRRQSLQIR